MTSPSALPCQGLSLWRMHMSANRNCPVGELVRVKGEVRKEGGESLQNGVANCLAPGLPIVANEHSQNLGSVPHPQSVLSKSSTMTVCVNGFSVGRGAWCHCITSSKSIQPSFPDLGMKRPCRNLASGDLRQLPCPSFVSKRPKGTSSALPHVRCPACLSTSGRERQVATSDCAREHHADSRQLKGYAC